MTLAIPPELEGNRPAWLRATDALSLQKQAGASVYGRGQTYAQAGAVQSLAVSFDQGALLAQAQIEGTRDYTVHWRMGAQGTVQGGCDCPHAQDGHFCKHQVALGLCLHALLAGEPLAEDEAARKKVAAAAQRARTQAARREGLLAFLGRQSATDLAARLWQWAERDRGVMADVKSWAASERLSTDGGDAQALKPVITELLAARGFVDYRQSHAYAERAQAAVRLLREALQHDAAQVRGLCEHALRRLWKVMASADDSDGMIGDVTQDLLDVLKQALAAAPPPASWLKNWLALLRDDPFSLWPDDAVVDAAGANFQQAWGQRVTADWLAWVAKNPPSQAPKNDRFHWDWERHRLRKRYINHLKRAGDIEAVLHALQTWRQGAVETSELVHYCESLGKYRQALQVAREGCTQFADDWRLKEDLLRCYERDGWDEEALVLRRELLARSPTVENYQATLQAAGAAGHDTAAYRAELMDWAAERERSAQKHHQRWNPQAPLDVSLRLGWLMHEGNLDEALALVQPPHAASESTLHRLALALPPDQAAATLALLQRMLEAHMQSAKSPYREALALVRQILDRHPPEQRRQWLQTLRTRYKPKRNFIKGLPDA